MALEGDAADGGEGLEVLGAGQLRHQVLRLDGQPHLTGSGCQVEVHTPVKSLLQGTIRYYRNTAYIINSLSKISLTVGPNISLMSK